VNFAEAIQSGFRNYVGFSGRAARSEFWFWFLFAVLVTIATQFLDGALFDQQFGLLRASPPWHCSCPDWLYPFAGFTTATNPAGSSCCILFPWSDSSSC